MSRMASPGRSTNAPTRVGLLLDSYDQPQWIRRVISDVQSSAVAEVVLVVKNGHVPQERAGFVRRLWKERKLLLYKLYSKLDQRLFTLEPDAFEPVDVADLLVSVAEVLVSPTRERFSDSFSPEDVEAIRAHDLDVALRFGFRILKGDALHIARHGVWSYHHDDPLVIRGGPPGFWEVMTDDPVTGSMLQVLTEDLDNGRVLYRSWSPTVSRFSVRKNNNNNFWKSSAFVKRMLEGLAAEDGDGLPETESPYRPYSRRVYRAPTNAEMAPLLWGLTKRAATRSIVKTLFFEQWALAYRFKSSPSDLNDSMSRFERLVPPKDRFWADPFPVVHSGRHYIFFEEFLYGPGRAHISVLEVSRTGVVAGPSKALERDYHLSYPFVFEWQDSVFMIPETGANHAVELYRCASFPDRWEPEKILLEANSPHDATLFEHGDTWWMFVNIEVEGVSTNWDELHLFHATSPLGPWQPHRRNPVKSDVRGSRPAGRLFQRDGALYRPSQDCSRRYGYATSINRVLRLTPDEYEEEEISKNLPEWGDGVIGTHTLNVLDDLTVVDFLARRRKIL